MGEVIGFDMKFLVIFILLHSIFATIAQDSNRSRYGTSSARIFDGRQSLANTIDADDSDYDDDDDEDYTPKLSFIRNYGRNAESTWQEDDDRYHVTRYRDNDRYHRDRHSDRDRYHRNRHRNGRYSRKRKHRRFYKSEMTLPSGIKKNITDPPKTDKWECNNKKPELIHLEPNGRMGKIEYNIVKDEVLNTWGAVAGRAAPTITKIEKITNNCLWKRYRYRLRQVVTEATAADERLLFYGADLPTIEKVIAKGFDERTLDLTSTAYGAGFNFVEKSSTSDASTTLQADGSRKMLMCRVTLGKMATGAAAVAHPPVGSNSVKGGTAADPVYLIYRGEQAYPEYLITYT